METTGTNVIDVEEVRELAKRRRKINSIPIEHLRIRESGNEIPISKEMVEEFKFIGLDNYYFILDEFYKGKITHGA